MPAKSPSNEIKLTRLYDAPVKTVWNAWTEPNEVAKWWGPRGFTLTTHHKDLRPGGSWKYTMHGPDGRDYENTTHYFEVERFSRLVYDHGASEDRPPLFHVTVTFTEVSGKTRMDMTFKLATPEAAAETRRFIKEAGGESTWDRLAEHLAEGEGKKTFVINRSFEAPIGRVFEMWSDPKHIARWLPPKGAEMQYLRADVRPGGSSFWVMTMGPMKMYGRIEYQELRSPDRIVYVQQFCDENEKMSRHPMAPTWPERMLTTVTLTAEGDDATRVTILWEPLGPTTAEELAAFLKERGGMTQGWTGSFDKLEALLNDAG